VGEMLGVTVQPGGMLGRFGRMEQALIAMIIQSPRRRRVYFIPFLYWQNTGASSKDHAADTPCSQSRHAFSRHFQKAVKLMVSKLYIQQTP